MDRITRFGDLSKVQKSSENKKRIVQMWRSSGISMDKFCEAHGLKKSTLGDWNKKLNKMEETKVDTFHDNPGRPPLIDGVGFVNIKRKVAELVHQQRVPRKRELRAMCEEEAVNTKRRRGEEVTSVTLSRQSISRIKEHGGISEGKAQGARPVP